MEGKSKLIKVLLVHNFYGSEAPSGENQVVVHDINLLRADGHEVVLFSRSSDFVRGIGLFGRSWNISF